MRDENERERGGYEFGVWGVGSLGFSSVLRRRSRGYGGLRPWMDFEVSGCKPETLFGFQTLRFSGSGVSIFYPKWSPLQF